VPKPARKPQLLSKDQREAIERELSHSYGRVILKADGHQLQLRVERWKALRYVVMVYVDGWLRGEWWKEGSEVGAKFWNRRTHQLFKKRELDAWRKAFGKRAAAERQQRGVWVNHEPFFPSARACLASLQRTCDAIEVVSVGYQPGDPDEVRKEETADA